MEVAVGWATVMVLEVSGSGGEGEGDKGGGGDVITSLSWGMGCNDSGGGTEMEARVGATLSWEAERSSNDKNGEFSSSNNFQRLKQQQQH